MINAFWVCVTTNTETGYKSLHQGLDLQNKSKKKSYFLQCNNTKKSLEKNRKKQSTFESLN